MHVQEVVEEYENLCKGRGSGSMRAGQANMGRNRYIDVLPYDHNAVVLPGVLPAGGVCLLVLGWTSLLACLSGSG